MTDLIHSNRRWLRLYTKFVAAATLFLIFAGAMVTSTGSGLAVPDWPLSYGMFFPPMVGGIFYEHGHRMIAAIVGLLTLIQAFWLHRRASDAHVRRLGWIAVAVVILQGMLGGLTVIFLLPPAISIAHAGLAELFLAMNVTIAFFSSRFYESRQSSPAAIAPDAPAIATLVTSAIFIQILLGALMRHLGAGLAIPDFPLSFGRVIPAFTSAAVAVNYAHRIGALIVTLLLLGYAPRCLRRAFGALRRQYGMMLVLLCMQITLGAFTVWSGKQPVITSLHVVTGAALFASSVVFTLSAFSYSSGAAQRRQQIVEATA